jgi:hypothetical protein
LVDALRELLSLRARFAFIKNSLYCSRVELGRRLATPTQSVADVLYTMSDRGLRRIALEWIDRFGPFLENDRSQVPDDLFFCQEHEVTEMGLGEAARRSIIGQSAGVYSFPGICCFSSGSIEIRQGFTDEPVRHIGVPNAAGPQRLKSLSIAELAAPAAWPQFIGLITLRYDKLAFGGDILDYLRPQPFSASLAANIFDLLDVLQLLMENMDQNGELTDRGVEIHQEYFKSGVWFSDESSTNKARFAKELTFRDPTDPTRFIGASWHGKVQTPQFRVHFEWPPLEGHDRMKIPYIGPKITKT